MTTKTRHTEKEPKSPEENHTFIANYLVNEINSI